MNSAATTTLYRLMITLTDIEPAIWRLVEVPDCSLGELHDVIQVSMGWDDSHMHQIILNGKYYGRATSDDLDLDFEDSILLSQVFTGKKKPRLIYEYDFGDSWRHEIVLKKFLESSPGSSIPDASRGSVPARRRIAEASGAMPPCLKHWPTRRTQSTET